MDGGPLTRPPNGYVESKDGLQVVDAVAVAALDTGTRDVDGCAAPGDRAGDGYTAPGVLEWNKGEHHLILRRCPRHQKHSRRRVEMLRFATQDLCEVKNPGSVINNCGGYVRRRYTMSGAIRPRLASRRLLTSQVSTLIS